MRLAQDATFRAEWISRRARAAEEAAWALADAARLFLAAEPPDQGTSLQPRLEADGRLWTSLPEDESVAVATDSRASDPAVRRDFLWTRRVAPLFADLRRRRPAIHAVSLWTSSGVVRRSPWIDVRRIGRELRSELGALAFDPLASFPEARPASGDAPVWTGAYAGLALAPEMRLVRLFVPLRAESGRVAGVIALDIDARRYVAEALESWEPAGDFWFAVDGAGHSVLMTPRTAAVLGWNGVGGATLAGSSRPELKRLGAQGSAAPQSNGEYLVDGKRVRIASARVAATGWVFFEGLSAEALEQIREEAARTFPPAAYSGLKREVLLLFVLLLPAFAVVIGIASRRVSAPVERLVRAAEDIGRERRVEVTGVESRDELGRLAAAIDTMGKRVARRVETLRRLHQFSRSAYRVTDSREIIARATHAIAAFTNAERVLFGLYDRNTNRLEAALPAWNVPTEMAERLKVSVDARSIAGMVYRTGEAYCANDLDRDPYANRELQKVLGGRNALYVPLKTEDETLGVALAINRPQGFGQEEIDAMTSFCDLASLLLKNARLYDTLAGTVEELRRASRLKDHFLQNVNHELRTPLTAIVGWTDLFEEGEVDEKTLRRGLKQIRQSARVLLALIDDLLDLARLDRGALTLERRAVSLSEIVQRSLDTVRMMADARGVVMILAPLPEPMPPVRADPLRLQQILWNLLANAIQFTPRHGRIVVRVEQEPERYLVSVEDDGIGIPESELPHVFERFRQVDGSATRGHAGMGIGLALARSLVELHGGSIWASSVVGQGSRFTFALPLRVTANLAAQAN